MRPPGGKIATAGAQVALVLICVVVFGRILSHGFLSWDDADEIFANPAFVPPTWSGVLSQWTTRPDETHYYKPVTQTVWGFLAAFAYDERRTALTAGAFHFGSLFVHSLSAVVVFRLLRVIVSGGTLASFLGALVFLVHPVQVEAVAWASGMKDLLCGLFTLLALLEWLHATDPHQQNGPHRAVHFGVATLCFVAAILSKPAGVIAPLLAGAVEWYVHRPPLKPLIIRLVPWLLISAAATIMTKVLMPAAIVERPPLWARPLVAGDALAFYLYKLAVPWNLAPDYGRRPMTVLSHAWVYIAWLVPFAIAVTCAFLWRRGFRAAGLGLTILVLSVLPVLGFVPTEFQYYSTVADHYLYVGLLGLALVTAAVVDRYSPRAAAFTGAAVVVLAGLSVRQAGFWENDIRLFRHTVQVNPQSFAGYSQLGFAYWHAKQPELSAEAYRNALRINPDHPNAHDIWIYYASRGDLDAAIRELGDYIAAAGKSPLLRRDTVATLHTYRGEMYMVRGRTDEAAADFRRALELKPDLTTARQHLDRLTSAATTQPTR